MAYQRTIPKVPDAIVNQVVADFESEHAIVVKRKDNGTWTVVATFP
jgi:hypothetical protein